MRLAASARCLIAIETGLLSTRTQQHRVNERGDGDIRVRHIGADVSTIIRGMAVHARRKVPVTLSTVTFGAQPPSGTTGTQGARVCTRATVDGCEDTIRAVDTLPAVPARC